MTDKELTRLAAKAAGIDAHGGDHSKHDDGRLWDCTALRWWNPLHDDGDALRLAVKLRLSIDHNHSADQQRWVAADRNGCEGCYAPVSCIEDEFEEAERPAATRRAIVRAAAALSQSE